MKKVALLTLTALFCVSAFAQNVKLPAPQKSGGKSLMEAISLRQTSREFDGKALTEQQLSNLMWAAYGFNRPGKRTVPSANDKQAYELYVVMAKGTYLYNAKDNVLELKDGKDLRALTGKQDFVKTAPVNIVFAYDTKKQGNDPMAHVDAGFIAQNIYLVCAAEGLATVIRGYIDGPAFAKALKLPENMKVVLGQTVGYPKK
jgi:nitroreductase